MIDSTAKIHPTALVHENAIIGKNVEVGPYTIIGDHVEIGDDCWIAPHVVIKGSTKIGKGNKIFQFSSIGEDCQDLKYNGEETFLEIGDNNVIRESCTFHRGTIQDQSLTKVGSNSLFMAYVHIAHDCIIGDNVIVANSSGIAGHCHIGNHVIIGGHCAFHQFTRVGDYAMTGGGSVVNKDIPPYFMASGHYADAQGINSVGLKRRGFDSKTIMDIKRAYKIICRKGYTLEEAKEELAKSAGDCSELQILLDFISVENRGIVR
jgi:UDP-N-acetylglucosamine acyltransferase